MFVGNPATPTLTAPANGSIGTALRPTLTWTAAAGAASYTVQIATDAAFTNIVYTATVRGRPIPWARTWRPTPSTSGA